MTPQLSSDYSLWEPQLQPYLDRFAPLYPGIQVWRRKVLAEAQTGCRNILGLLAADGSLVGLAITKNRSVAKLCHISLDSSIRGFGLGEQLLKAAVTSMVSNGASRIHVTTSDQIGEAFGGFFARFGFELSKREKHRYRTGADELVWIAVARKLASVLDRQVSSPVLIGEGSTPVRGYCGKELPHEEAPNPFAAI